MSHKDLEAAFYAAKAAAQAARDDFTDKLRAAQATCTHEIVFQRNQHQTCALRICRECWLTEVGTRWSSPGYWRTADGEPAMLGQREDRAIASLSKEDFDTLWAQAQCHGI
jgi:hypothetical protein